MDNNGDYIMIYFDESETADQLSLTVYNADGHLEKIENPEPSSRGVAYVSFLNSAFVEFSSDEYYAEVSLDTLSVILYIDPSHVTGKCSWTLLHDQERRSLRVS